MIKFLFEETQSTVNWEEQSTTKKWKEFDYKP